MPKLSIYNIAGQATGEEIELNDEVFGVPFNEPVVHQAVVMLSLIHIFIRGSLDTAGVANRNQARSKYGAKRAKAKK